MHGLPEHDGDRRIDWGQTSSDYAIYRPGPPNSFYHRLAALDVGLPGQEILDLGTGTGVLAMQFASQGARVAGVDVSPEQIEFARRMAAEEGLAIDFRVAPAEALPWEGPAFDIATANQCWLYFDKLKALAELRRVLKPGGWLVTSHFSWLPREDVIARSSEALVLKFNPDWSAADWPGEIPPLPAWARERTRLRAMFYYDEEIPFTRETWRGRIRACRGVGATLSDEQVAEFDVVHERLLQEIAPESFSVLHRIDAHVFELAE